MRNGLLALVLLLIVIFACASPKTISITPQPTELRSYDVGAEVEAATGDAMLRVGRAYSLPMFTPVTSFDAPRVSRSTILWEMPNFKPGETWSAVREDADRTGYYVRAPERTDYTLHITKDGRPGKGWVFSEDLRPAKQGEWPEDALFERVQGIPTKGSFEAELVYSGRSGDTVRMVYREYVDGLARPAFTQELEYDLLDDTSVAFKSLRINILEAGNSSIRFVVTDDGGLPWLPAN